MSDDREVLLPPYGKPPAIPHGQAQFSCRDCGANADRSTLSALGGRCGRCHSAWCSAGTQYPPRGPDFKGPKAWALTLQWREQQGQALSRTQRSAWRKALRVEDGES